MSASGAQQPAPTANVIAGDTPGIVATGAAPQTGAVAPSAVLKVNVGLAVRNSAQLDALIQAAGTPGSPTYGQYLTQAQYLANYAPTTASVQAASSWLTSQGLSVTGVSADNTIISTQGTVSQLNQAFGVSISNYSYAGRSFHSNDSDPTRPAGLGISWVSGLSNLETFTTFHTATFRSGGYLPSDFRQAYNVSGSGAGQTIGFTLWGSEIPQSDFTSYAAATGTTPITVTTSSTAADGLDWQPILGTSTDTSQAPEIAMDAEIAHGMAPGSHLTFFLGTDSSQGTMEAVLDAAASSNISIFSSSWGCYTGVACAVDPVMETALQHAAATGKTFYFASGDAGRDAAPSYPADSQYVVSVGGTSLTTDSSGNYPAAPGESAWAGSGGGCSTAEPRPAWQTGVGTPIDTDPFFPTAHTAGSACSGRAEPDVSADADPGTGALVYYNGTHTVVGGTSLAAPLWAGMSADLNVSNAAAGKPSLGFDGPLIYQLANDAPTYAQDFHDVTTGCSGGCQGLSVGTGWDEVTGWGSPNFGNIAATLAPHAPTSVVATAGNASATVSFTPPPVGGSPIASYTVTASPGGAKATGTASPITVTGLTNGTSYTFTVTETNTLGITAVSAASAAVAPKAVPGAPTAVTATAGNAQATVKFTAPAPGGAAITSYTVTASPGGAHVSGSASPLTVTGLTNGTSYTFTVTATSSLGTGPASAVSNAVVPAAAPGAPTGVTAVAGAGQATVSFTAPASNGGAAITSYTVTASSGAKVSGAASPITVTGLTNGTSYTFTVTATNAVGTSAASTASAAVTPKSAPGAPTAVTAVAGNGQAIVSFTAPASNGAAITSYTVTTSTGAKASAAASPITVTGLTNGTSYTFTVTATNSVGIGPASSASAAVTPKGLATAPTSVTAVAGNGQATVSFVAPASNGGAAITSYTVTSSSGAKVSGAASPLVVTGLTNGTSYTFTVTATNSVGVGPASAVSNAVVPVGPPGPPTTVTAVAGAGQATVSFKPPATTGGAAITSYMVTASPGGARVTGTASPIVVTGLTNGTSYTFTVTATNPAGTSAASTPSAAVTPKAATGSAGK